MTDDVIARVANQASTANYSCMISKYGRSAWNSPNNNNVKKNLTFYPVLHDLSIQFFFIRKDLFVVML